MYSYPSRKEKKSGKRELVTVTMRKETDKQGVEGVVESESTRGGGYCHIWAIGMCRCEGYGFQAVYSRIGYINQSVWL